MNHLSLEFVGRRHRLNSVFILLIIKDLCVVGNNLYPHKYPHSLLSPPKILLIYLGKLEGIPS